MDTSKEYVRMCEKAGEIQEEARKRGLETVDYRTIKSSQTYKNADNESFRYIRGEIMLFNHSPYSDSEFIFLPRQDQLQEMVHQGTPYYHKLRMIWEAYQNGLSYEKGFKSMEQLWLAYVMHDKFGKVWNGTEWVKEK